MTVAGISAALIVWAAAVALYDWRRRRVPNLLLLVPVLPTMLMLAIDGRGLLGPSLIHSAAGLAIAALPLLPGYAMGYLGAGDVKLSASIGLLLGLGALEMLLMSLSLLGLYSAGLVLWRRGQPSQTPRRRIAAAPAFSVAMVMQLIFGRLLPWNP